MLKTKKTGYQAPLCIPIWLVIVVVVMAAPISAPKNAWASQASAGQAPATQVPAAQAPVEPQIILSAKDAFLYTYNQIARLTHEEARVLFVDAGGNVLKVAAVTQNFQDGIYYIPWEVAFGNFTPAGTKKIYMVHNHPNGSNWLSDADIELGSFWAHKVKRLGITLDLLAVTANNGYASMLESGQLRPEQKGLAGAGDEIAFIVQPGLAMVGAEIIKVVKNW